MINKNIGLFVFLILLYQSSFSQKLEFEHLTDKDGLVHNSVTSILKDSYGYMWFGTFNGLSRYDGYNFTNYFKDPRNSHSITDNRIRFVFESMNKTLFVGFQYTGFSIYNRETGTFKRFRHDPKDPNTVSHDYVLSIHEDKKGNVWLGTRAGLDKFDIKTQSFVHYAPPDEDDCFVSSICEDEHGNLWLYGRGDHIYKFSPANKSFETITFTNDFNYPFTWGGTLKYDTKGNLWIGTEGNGLYRYNTKNGKKDWYSIRNKKLRKSDIVFSIIEDKEGKIWIGTDGGGIYRYSYTTDAFELSEHEAQDPASLSANAVYCIYESAPGVIWVGTFNLGINIYKKYKHKFFKYGSIGQPGHCLSERSVTSIKEGADGKIWIGTDGGGLNSFDPQTRQFNYFTPENSVVHSYNIKSIYLDKENKIWLGSYGSGLCAVNLKEGKPKIYTGNIHSSGETILCNHVWDIAESADNKVWIGLLNYGINVYDRKKEKFEYYPFDTAAFSQGACNVYEVVKDSKDRMWIGTEMSGAGYFDPDKKSFVVFKKQDDRPGSISSNNVRHIFEDSQGTIWIATFEGGLNKLVNIETGQFENYTIKDGLPTNNIQTVLEDDHHNLWLATDKGITQFKVAEKKFINFDMEDGLQSIQFNYCAALKSKDGYLYFGGTEGFNMFHPDSIRFNSTPPIVVFTDFKLFNKSVVPNKIYNDRVILRKVINMSDTIKLTYYDNIFSIEFAALDFTSPQKNKYAYKLEGFKNQWTYVNADKRFPTYTNLDPGEYTFRVIACNNDGVWNTTGASLRIIILPPWWMTWWFRTAMALLVIGLVLCFYYIRLRSIRKKNKLLEEEVKRRTAEIMKQQEEIIGQKNELEYLNKTKDKFFSIIGHDLKGPVKAVTALADILKDETNPMINDKQRSIINHIATASHKVQDLVLNLLEWARAQSKQITIQPAPVLVSKLFNDTIEHLSEQASQKQIQIKVVQEGDMSIFGDYNMISTIVRNILSNSIKYTPGGGLITLSSSVTTGGEVKLSIADSGIGMSEEMLQKLFTIDKGPSVNGTANETGTGLGMVISKEFAELNKGRIYAESILGKGSTFYILFPAANIAG